MLTLHSHSLPHSLPPSLPPSLPQILIQSVCETMVPKLVAEDIPLLHSLLSDVFPGIKYSRAEMGALRAEIAKVCAELHCRRGRCSRRTVGGEG